MRAEHAQAAHADRAGGRAVAVVVGDDEHAALARRWRRRAARRPRRSPSAPPGGTSRASPVSISSGRRHAARRVRRANTGCRPWRIKHFGIGGGAGAGDDSGHIGAVVGANHSMKSEASTRGRQNLRRSPRVTVSVTEPVSPHSVSASVPSSTRVERIECGREPVALERCERGVPARPVLLDEWCRERTSSTSVVPRRDARRQRRDTRPAAAPAIDPAASASPRVAAASESTRANGLVTRCATPCAVEPDRIDRGQAARLARFVHRMLEPAPSALRSAASSTRANAAPECASCGSQISMLRPLARSGDAPASVPRPSPRQIPARRGVGASTRTPRSSISGLRDGEERRALRRRRIQASPDR